MLAAVAVVLAVVLPCHAVNGSPQWVSTYANWRNTEPVTVAEWERNYLHPKARQFTEAELEALPLPVARDAFKQCLEEEAQTFTNHVLKYRSPKLQEVTAAVREELDRRFVREVCLSLTCHDVSLRSSQPRTPRSRVGRHIYLCVLDRWSCHRCRRHGRQRRCRPTRSHRKLQRSNFCAVGACRQAVVIVTVFWGRQRYVSILERYLRRNLRVNGGIVDELLLITTNRDHADAAVASRQTLTELVAEYPGVVREVPFCPRAYGCAFDKIMTNTRGVYTKIDDDTLFIRDGSFEHLVYQVGCMAAG